MQAQSGFLNSGKESSVSIQMSMFPLYYSPVLPHFPFHKSCFPWILCPVFVMRAYSLSQTKIYSFFYCNSKKELFQIINYLQQETKKNVSCLQPPNKGNLLLRNIESNVFSRKAFFKTKYQASLCRNQTVND